MCASFLETEVLPMIDRIDNTGTGTNAFADGKSRENRDCWVLLFRKIWVDLGKDFITSTLVNEGLGGGYSFSVAIAAHTGIGTLPILYFGTEDKKKNIFPNWPVVNGKDLMD